MIYPVTIYDAIGNVKQTLSSEVLIKTFWKKHLEESVNGKNILEKLRNSKPDVAPAPASAKKPKPVPPEIPPAQYKYVTARIAFGKIVYDCQAQEITQSRRKSKHLGAFANQTDAAQAVADFLGRSLGSLRKEAGNNITRRSKTGFRYVYFKNKSPYYTAQPKNVSLGTFKTPLEAARRVADYLGVSVESLKTTFSLCESGRGD